MKPDRKTQDKETTVKFVYKHYVTQKLEKYFRIKKGELKESTEMEFDVLYYPMLEKHEFYKLIYAGHYAKIVLEKLWNGKKFLKSGLYASILEARNNVPSKRASDVIVAVHVGGEIWFVYESEDYDGLGGIFVRTDEGNFVIEPMDHYLEWTAPHPESE